MHNPTHLMLEQLMKANMWLDTAELIGIRDVKERCIAQATEAEGRVRSWLRDGGCPGFNTGEVAEALEGLSARLAMQSSDEETNG